MDLSVRNKSKGAHQTIYSLQNRTAPSLGCGTNESNLASRFKKKERNELESLSCVSSTIYTQERKEIKIALACVVS